ncbi:MAG TPA: hypothetical protein VK982_07095 [Bacteroidales bacterium]|nr:hypothetical protein [Bacteroidales bacterium]
MKCKVKKGKEHLYLEVFQKDWDSNRGVIIVNFNNRWVYLSHKQWKNHLLIETIDGQVDIVFCGEVPKVELSEYEKNQLIFNYKIL